MRRLRAADLRAARRCAAIIGALSAASGCASQASGETPTSETGSLEPPPPMITGEPLVSKPLTGTAKSPAEPATRELTAADCQALAGKYGDLTRSDEMAKLSKKITDEERERGRVNIDKGATILAGRWEDSCVKNLTGKLAQESSLKCAMQAKTVAAFDVCINGPASDPPPATR